MTERKCAVCGALLTRCRSNKTCSPECSDENRRRLARRWRAIEASKRAERPPIACRGCGAMFSPRKHCQYYCRPACAGGTRTCLQCGQPSGAQPWCSLPCRHRYQDARRAAPLKLAERAAPLRCSEDELGRMERRTRCRQYDTCLAFAARHDWPGFTCARCPVQDERPEREIFEEVLAHAAVSRQHAGSIWDNVAIEGVDIVRGQR